MFRCDNQDITGIASSNPKQGSDDQRAVKTVSNDDSGFHESVSFTDNSFEQGKSRIGRISTQTDPGTELLYSSYGQEQSHFKPEVVSAPRSSSTPNRVEIFIDESWNSSTVEDIENIPFDLILNDNDFSFVDPEERKTENTGEKTACVLQPLRESNCRKNKTEPVDENPREIVLSKAFEQESPICQVKTEPIDVNIAESINTPTTNNEPLKLLYIKTEIPDKDFVDDMPNLAISSIHSEQGPDFSDVLSQKETTNEDKCTVQSTNSFKIKTDQVQADNKLLASDSEDDTDFPVFCESLKCDTEWTNKRHTSAKSDTDIKTSDQKFIAESIGSANPTRKRMNRKNMTPRRSPTKCDPRFKGAIVWLQTEYKAGRSRLNISAFYSNVAALFSDGARRSLFGNHVFTRSPGSPSYSDTEENSTPPHGRETYMIAKTCASCRTRRTPLWRDAEDGTPLCNACGIRYKKYRLRCSRCWHIPKKDIKTYPNCPSCGASLRYVFSRRTW